VWWGGEGLRVIEKDLWVCWLLARLHDVPGVPGLTFKGGTSLSKVHDLIQRFSEDIDLTFSREGWGFDGERDPLSEGLSGKKRERLIKAIAEHSAGIVRDVVVPGLEALCADALGDSGWTVEIADDDPQVVLFTYPSPSATYTYGKPVVKAEFGARGDPWPTAPRMVRAYLEEMYEGIAATTVVEVTTLEVERTFWEKVTLLHAIHHGTLVRPEKRVERLSRHAYDIHRMWGRPELRERLVADPALLQRVVNHKKIFFKEGKARYELIDDFTLNAAPHDALEARLRDDYKAMESMFFPESEVPDFGELLATLREVEQAVARWR
jgi:hypothetical protein